MNISLEYYKIFYYVARQGSVTAAAAELSVSQPAVSQAIKALEHAVGIPLFVRTGKGVRLTPAGEILYSYVQNGYETILRGEKKLRGFTRPTRRSSSRSQTVPRRRRSAICRKGALILAS